MAGDLSVSMTLRLVDQVSQPLQGIVAALNGLNGASQQLNQTGATDKTGTWEAERTAVGNVTTAVNTLRTATAEAASPIETAIGRFNAEREAVSTVTAAVGALQAATTQSTTPIDAAIGKLNAEREAVRGVATAMHDLGGAGQHTDGAAAAAGPGGTRAMPDWSAYWADKYAAEEKAKGATAAPAALPGLDQVGDQAERAGDKVDALQTKLARLGEMGWAFGEVSRLGDRIGRPIEAAQDAFTDFEQRTQDLATQSDQAGGREAVGSRVLRVARDANVPWESVLAAQRALVSVGGGEQLKTLTSDLETRLNKLAVASGSGPEDLYTLFSHYTKAGMAGPEAVSSIEQQYVQGKRGAFELKDLAHYMPTQFVLGKGFGLDNQQAATDTSALLELARESTGSAQMADTVVRHVMGKLGDPRTVKRLDSELGIDVWGERDRAKAAGENPMMAVLKLIGDKFAALPEGEAKAMGTIAPDQYFRTGLEIARQHLGEVGDYRVSAADAEKQRDADYAANQSTVAAQLQRQRNAEQAAAIAAGQTGRGVTIAASQAKTTAWDAGGSVAQTMPVTTGVVGTITGALSATATAIGGTAETVLGALSAWQATKWLATKIPGAAGPAAEAVGAEAVGVAAGSAGAATGGAATAAAGMAPETAVAIGTAIGTAAGTAIVAGAGGAAMAGTIVGLRNATPDLGQRGRAEPPSIDKAQQSGHWTFGRGGFREWVVDRAATSLPSGAAQQPALTTAAVQAMVAPLQSAIATAIAGTREARGVVVPTAQMPPAGPVTNNNQKTVNQTFNISAPTTVNATLTNTTPGAVGAAAGAGVRAAIGAGKSTAALHDGFETK